MRNFVSDLTPIQIDYRSEFDDGPDSDHAKLGKDKRNLSARRKMWNGSERSDQLDFASKVKVR